MCIRDRYAVVSEVFFDSANEDLPPFLYSLDSGEKLVALVELVDGEEITLGPINFSDDGKQVAVAYTRHSAKDVDWVRVWDTETLQVVKDIPLAEETIAIEFNAHKEQILIVQSDGILKWSIQSGASDGVIQLSKDSLAHATIRLHPGGNRLAVGINESILLINLESGEEVAEMSFRGYINDLRWSPDGTLLFGAMDNGTLQVWNASEKDGVFQAEKSSIDAYWHANQADKYEGSNDWFAALFHRAWLLKHDPKHPFAWCLLHDTHEKFQAQYSSGAAPVLPKIVVQMLELEKGDASNNMKLSRSDRAVGSSLMSRLIDESSWRESVRPRFAQAALQTINEKGVIVPTALALLEYRLENYSAAIDYANVAKDRRKKSEKTPPIELAILALSYKAQQNSELSEEFTELFHQQIKHLNKTTFDESEINAQLLFAELKNFEPDAELAKRCKASRGGSFGLSTPDWPARMPERSLKNTRGGGVF